MLLVYVSTVSWFNGAKDSTRPAIPYLGYPCFLLPGRSEVQGLGGFGAGHCLDPTTTNEPLKI